MKDKISKNEVFEAYKDGLPEDFNLESSKVRRKPVKMQGVTVQISMKIEYELLQNIKNASEKKGLPYQTFIKQILRNHLKKPSIEQRIQKLEATLFQREA